MQWSDRIGRRLKLRDLHILLAVARSGSMGKAAADLAISQPSISKAIADVEHAVGLRLLDRGPQGIEPTIYGRALLKCGTAVFDELAARRQGARIPDRSRQRRATILDAPKQWRQVSFLPLAIAFRASIRALSSTSYPGTASRSSTGSFVSAPSTSRSARSFA